jgi:hypothetical protein
VTPYCLQNYFDPFAFFLAFEDFHDCFKDQGVRCLYCTIELQVVHRGKGYLCPYLMEKFLERVIVKLLGIVDCDFFQNTKAANDVLPKKTS